jgi:hypothetical protein
MISQVFRWFRRPKKSSRQLPTRIVADAAGVTVFAVGNELASFRWDQVAAVTASKQDLFTTDCVWLEFELEDATDPVCVHEELEGYRILVDEMERYCVGFVPDWWQRVAFPAFVPNVTLIWKRGGKSD